LNAVICNKTKVTAIEKDLDFNIYPNPADGQLNILGLDNSDFKIEIYNTIGNYN